MNPPRVSVCIANYNGAGIIADCIRSVLERDCDFPVEIIVHDDASTDGSAQHARVIGACLRIPKTLWNEIGGFPE
jgi:glycosyltransferase involved in cell wall biosynthesis